MRYTKRLARPAALDLAQKGLTELDRSRKHFNQPGRVDGFKFKAYSQSEVKEALSDMFLGKCAYCESRYDVTQHQDVEHYRPKGRIDTANGKLKPGYWWLASAWENLVPSCILCNRVTNYKFPGGKTLKLGKGDQFPLDDESRRARSEGNEVNEIPLLVNPCIDNPTDYIRFAERNGECLAVPVSEDPTDLSYRRADTSIRIYGLNRVPLVRERTDKLTTIKFLVVRLEKAVLALNKLPDDPELADEVYEILNELRRLCGERMHYSIMCTQYVEPRCGGLGLKL